MKEINLKNPVLIVFIFLLSSNSVNAQFIQWSRTFGGSSQDGGESMVLADNGDVVIAGFKTVNNSREVLLLKTDTSGNEIWSRTYDIGVNDWGRSLKKTSDGGYIIAGMTGVTVQVYDPFLIKTDSAGNILWHRTYDYGFGADDRGHSVWQTSDGGYIIAGQTHLFHGLFANYDMYVIKTDANGNVQWTKIFFREEEGGDVALGIQQLPDGGYIIGGFTQSSSWASYVIRTDSLGNAVWSNIYPGSWQSECYDIMSTPDGGFVLTGTESSFDTDTDLLILKLNADGNLLWKKIYGTVDAEIGQSIQRLQDGGYIIAGMSSHGAGGYDMYVVRTNSTGDSIWSKTIGGKSDDRAFAVSAAQNGTHYVTGWAWSYGLGQGDVYLVKIAEPLTGIHENNFIPEAVALFQNYPNPFNPVTNLEFGISKLGFVSLKVYNTLGKEVAALVNEKKNPGRYIVKFDARDLTSGVYFYTLRADGFSETKRMILLK